MVDLEYLQKLISTLSGSRVSSFKSGDLELNFYVEQSKAIEPPIPTQDHTVEVPIDESQLPPDLRTDNITSYDTLMNWSGSPIEREEPIPGVGDDPLHEL